MSDPIEDMLEAVGKELAGHGISMATLSAQALGKASMEAPDGLALLAACFSPEHALWFFEFLRGYLTTPEPEQAGEMPDPGKLKPAMAAAFATLPLTGKERDELMESLLQPFEPKPEAAAAPPEAPAPAETPEEMIASLEKRAEELKKELDAKLAELKAPEAPAPEAETPAAAGDAAQPSEKAVGKLEAAVADLQQALEEALGKLPPSGL